MKSSTILLFFCLSVIIILSLYQTQKFDNFAEKYLLYQQQDFITGIVVGKQDISSRIDLDVSFNRSLVYVHTGKTGGVTLNIILPALCASIGRRHTRQDCFRMLKQSNTTSRLGSLVGWHIHTSFPKQRRTINNFIKNNATSFLFTLRLPVSRIVSAYNFQNPKNHRGGNMEVRKFYEDCFPTIDDLALVMGRKVRKVETNLNNQTVDCFDLGKETLSGKAKEMGHFYFNYEKYTAITSARYPGKEILVIRTEKLWDDLRDLNVALGGNENDFDNATGHTYDHGSSEFQLKTHLSSSDNKAAVCCFLYKENEIYEDLLKRSVNILDSEKARYLDLLYSDCGVNRELYNGNFSWSEWASEKNCTHGDSMR